LTPLTLDRLESIYKALYEHEKKQGSEPLPPFAKANKEQLQSAVRTVEAEYFEQSNYETLIEKAAAYLYFINKSHALPNGNKRFSIACFKTYVYLNNFELNVSHEFLREAAILIAQSDLADKDDLVRDLVEFMKDNKWIVRGD